MTCRTTASTSCCVSRDSSFSPSRFVPFARRPDCYERGGRIALNVWKPLAHHPIYEALLKAEACHLDADLATVATPFTFGDTGRLTDLMDGVGFEEVEVTERTLNVEFTDPDTFVALTVMAGAAVVPELAPEDEEERSALIEAVSRDSADILEQYRDGNRLVFAMPNQIPVGFV